MPSIRYEPGTKSPKTPGLFTDQQWAALGALKETATKLRYGAARAEFVNKVLLADGTVSDNLDPVRVAAAMQRPDEPGNLAELQDALAQRRFLLVVDADMVPRTYFQCFVPNNPDVEVVGAAPLPEARPGFFARIFGGGGAALVLFVAVALAGDQPAWDYLIGLIGALDLKNTTANYALDQLYDNKFPASSVLRIRTGGVAGAENADTGTVLATITLPASPWAAAASGSKAKNGTWQDASADATGTAAHFRLSDALLAENEEGTVTLTGGGGDMELDNTSIAAGQQVSVTTYTRTL